MSHIVILPPPPTTTFSVFFGFFEIESPSVAQAGLAFGMILPLLLEYWDHRPMPPYSALSFVSFNLEQSHSL